MIFRLTIWQLSVLSVLSGSISCLESYCLLTDVSTTQRQNTQCDLSCMASHCGFDAVSPSVSPCLSVCASHCDTSLLGNGVCENSEGHTGCNTADCGWDLADCGYCAQGCKSYSGFLTMLRNGICDSPCNTASCNYDDADCIVESAPVLIYVSPQAITKEYGSFEAPYSSLHKALLAIWAPFTEVRLLSGLHKLTLSERSNNLDPLLRDSTSRIKSVLITTEFCQGESTPHAQCASKPAEIMAPMNQIMLTVNTRLRLVDLVFRGDYDMVPGCFETTCTQCVYAVYDAGDNTWMGDQGQVLDITKVAPNSVCQDFVNFNFINTLQGSALDIVRVTFRYHRQQAKSLITTGCSNNTFTDVDFVDVQPAKNSGNSAVIRQQSFPPYCGTLRYLRGTVTLINNGYEMQSDTLSAGFMRVNNYELLQFEFITFRYNNVLVGSRTGADSFSMYFINPRQVIIRNCVFEYNMAVSGGAFFITANQQLPTSLTADGELIDQSLVHFLVENSVFNNNTADNGGAFSIAFAMDHQNIVIRNCSFTNNFASTGGVVQFLNSYLSDEFSVGATVPIFIGSTVINAFSPPRYIIVDSVNFTRNYAPYTLRMSFIGQVVFKNVRFNGNGMSTTGITYINYMLAGYVASIDTYLTGWNLSAKASQCLNIFDLSNVYNISFADLKLYGGNCDAGSPGIYLSGNTSVVTITQLAIDQLLLSNNRGPTASVILSLSIPLVLSSITCRKGVGDARAESVCLLLKFSAPYSLSIVNSTFQDNVGSESVAGFVSGAKKVLLSNVTLANNTASSGSAGFVISTLATEVMELMVGKVNFTGNKGSDGGLLTLIDVGGKMTSGVYCHLSISDFFCANNTGTRAGTCVSIQNFLALSNSTSIHNSTFFSNSNSEQGAALSFSFRSGLVTVSNCTFTANAASKGSAIYANHRRADSLLTITDSIFSEHSGGSVIQLVGAGTKPIVTTTRLRFIGNKCPSLSMTFGELTDSDSMFIENRCKAGPVAFVSTHSVLRVAGAVAKGNAASFYSGGVYATSGSSVYFVNCSLTENSSEKVGGVVYVDQSSVVSFNSCQVRSNRVAEKGSVIYALYSSISITNSQVSNNSAGTYGTIYLSDSSLTVSNSTVSSNSALGSSPGVVSLQSNITVSFCTFSNQLGESGALFSLEQSALFMTSSEMSDCHGTVSGGCVFATAATLYLKHTKIIHCSAPGGACISLLYKSQLHLTDVLISQSDSANDLGAINLIESQLAAAELHFTDTDGGMVSATSSEVAVSHASFVGGRGKQGAALQLVTCVSATVADSVFEGNFAELGGAVFVQSDGSFAIMTISQSEFRDNRGYSGGAVYMHRTNVSITESLFERNAAISDSGSGGAVYSLYDISQPCGIEIRRNQFLHNSAGAKGGAVYWQHSSPLFADNTFKNSSAHYGADIASYAIRLMAVRSNGEIIPYINASRPSPVVYSIDNLGSGSLYDGVIRLGLFDHQNQLVTLDYSSAAEIVIPTHSNITVFGDLKSIAVGGIYAFSQFRLTATPESTQEVVITTPSLRSQDLSALDLSALVDSVTVQLSFRRCLMGEHETEGQCVECPFGTYSFAPEKPCAACPSGAICFGNYTMVPDKGYWRADVYSDVFFACNYPDACTGSAQTAPLSFHGDCAPGYKGNLCDSCEPDHSKTGKNICAKCPSLFVNFALTGSILIVALVFLAVVIYISIRSANRPNSELAIYLKILMNYAQMVIVAASLNMKWPSYTSQFLSAQVMVGNAAEQIFSVDCILQEVYSSNLFYSKIIVTSMLPLLLMALSSVVWLLLRALKPVEMIHEKLMATLVMILFLLHTTITKTEFAMFSCIELAKGELWLVPDMQQQCWSSSHVRYSLSVAVPSIIVWVVGLPLVCLATIVKHKLVLNNPRFQMQFSFLYRGYLRKRFYWEFVILYRKIALVVPLVFLAPVSAAVQAQTVLAVLLLSAVFQIQVEPFQLRTLNNLEVKSIFVSIITIYCGLYYECGVLSKLHIDVSMQVLLFIVIVCANTYFLGSWMRLTVPKLFERFRDFLHAVQRYRNPAANQSCTVERLENSVSYSHSRISAIVSATQAFHTPDNSREVNSLPERSEASSNLQNELRLNSTKTHL